MAADETQSEIWAWEDDPGAPGTASKPTQRPAPAQPGDTLPVAITGRAPAPDLYDIGTPQFRYWAAAEALRRSADLWSASAPGLEWFESVGPKLRVKLDAGEDLNAYYDRKGLSFFHTTADGVAVFSGESPDVLCHELGHAVLDALRPETWDAPYLEVAALHESFGDISALLSGLQLKTVRASILVETDKRIYRSSRLSRLAEQLGWAIRVAKPDAVDRDCLRNAVNSFSYAPPETLPADGPASTLTSEPHSFSRVFTAAALQGLAGMFRLERGGTEALLRVSEQLAALLVDAVRAAPVVSTYYSQFAAHVIEADATRFDGRYAEVLRQAFVRRGILSLPSANTISTIRRALPASPTVAAAAPRGEPRLHLLALPGAPYGLEEDLLVPAITETKRFAVAGAAAGVGSAEPPAHDRAAAAFVEALFRRGRVDVSAAGPEAGPLPRARPSTMTHVVLRTEEGLVLRRRLFDSGRRRRPGPPPEPDDEAPADEEAEARFVSGLVQRGEAVRPDEDGELPPGATHEIVEEDGKGERPPKVRRRRFSISGDPGQ